ncbi:hypothetical protein D9M71_638160 [compost metagenome]
MRMADQRGRHDRRDLRLLQQALQIDLEQTRIAAQLATHEYRRAEAIPAFGFQRRHHLDRHMQLIGYFFQRQPSGLTGPAELVATSHHTF